MRFLRGLVVLVAAPCVAALASCQPATCSDMCAALSVTVSFATGAESVPVTDGATMPWAHGFQGGTMIQPLIQLDPAEVQVGDDVDVTLTHAPDPANPGALGEAGMFPRFHVRATAQMDYFGHLSVGPIADQVGWNGLDGVKMTFTVDVATRTRRFTQSYVITLMEAPPSSCTLFTRHGTGCLYRTVPGTLRVTSITDPGMTATSCTDPRHVEVEFVADDPTEAGQCAMALQHVPIPTPEPLTLAGEDPPATCVTSLGLAVGTTRRTTVDILETGTCTPFLFGDGLQTEVASCTCH